MEVKRFEVKAAFVDYVSGGVQKRAPRGKTVADLPEASIPWLLANGSIVEAAQADEVETVSVGEAEEGKETT